MALVKDWQELCSAFPEQWTESRVGLTLEEAGDSDRVLTLLAPLQPVRTGPGSATILIARSGGGASSELLRRSLQRLDAERLYGRLELISVDEAPAAASAEAGHRLPQGWDAALAGVPADWSDLLGQIELDSSDYIEPGALHMAPINPRRIGRTMLLQFRCARQHGYGASPGMVRRCFERCDDSGITGRVEILRVLSDTRPVGTQGPVWHIGGQMV